MLTAVRTECWLAAVTATKQKVALGAANGKDEDDDFLGINTTRTNKTKAKKSAAKDKRWSIDALLSDEDEDKTTKVVAAAKHTVKGFKRCANI
jgi:hypothetical protein